MKKLIGSLLLSVLAPGSFAAPAHYDFKDPKGVNNVIFKTDAPLESINGTAGGVSGIVTFDPDKPEATTGKIIVAAASLTVPNSMMKQHLQSPNWLDVEKYPEITFEVKELKNVKKTENVYTGDAAGTFTLHGVSKEMTIPVKLTHLKDRVKDRIPGRNGDLLVIRSNFQVKRSDFKINAGQNTDKVSDEIDLTLSVAGMTVNRP